MAIDLLNHKLDRAFDHIDANGNGVVERADLLGLGARILVGFGESPTSVTGASLVESFDGIWATLARTLERDGDSGIARPDFRTAMTAAFVTGGHYDPVFRPATVAVAELCDGDRDGEISPGEFRTMLSAFGVAYDDVDEAFDRLDRAGRGRLTVAGLVAAAADFYRSADPNAPGNWLFGPL
ncbi:EF-hand domain-containing protein [Actinomadura sp. ATCC 31491]|uniref:EF-hand domain-containing protein n=1 Tax=Actinomadura luzonensis TaxID=2805427 RepID=A0ABT0G7L5_9ACTN|nr:EF-hand domain-containing protein [Actinomadura luzonensis]MCK2220587.1 EF-hand domain-containing protein [Actinomadura luzonensis]